MADKYERIPMRSYETEAMQYLLGSYQEIESASEVLRKRLGIIGERQTLAGMANRLGEIISELLKTVPVNKLATLQANLQNLKLFIRIEKPVTGENDVTHSYVDTELLTDVLKDFQSERCSMCMGTDCDQKACKYKELMDSVIVEDLPENPFGCKYRYAEWK